MMLTNGTTWDEWQQRVADKQLTQDIKNSAEKQYEFFVGVDLGKMRDSSVIAALQVTKTRDGKTYDVKGLHVLKRGVDYPAQVAAILEYFDKGCFSLWGKDIYIDSSGLGEPVADMLIKQGVKLERCVITASGQPKGPLGIK